MTKVFFDSKEISGALYVPLDRWKRWGREFLGLDPVAGQSGGIARQFTLEQAFHIYLGGWLVNQLNFSIPESRAIVNELKPWLKDRGMWPGYQAKQTGEAWDLVKRYTIDIYKKSSGKFVFVYNGYFDFSEVEYEGYKVSQEKHISSDFLPVDIISKKLLPITLIIRHYLGLLNDMDKPQSKA